MKICIATTEILGAHRNGGIGTASSHLAILLAHGGHKVTLLNGSDERLEPNGLWSSLYKRFGVRVVPLPFNALSLEPWELRAPTAYFDYLWTRDFDVAIFQDWLGLAHACTLAKAAALAFRDTLLVVNTHGPMAWVHDVAGVAPPGRGKLIQIEVERQAVERADMVISPSQYLVDWMRENGWRLPAETRVIQNFLDGFGLAGLKTVQAPPAGLQPHLVYFGRLERRKGIFLFLEALLAEPLAERDFTLSFLGREVHLTAATIREWLAEHRPDLLNGLQIHTDKTAEEAMAFLKESRGIAVIPSYADNSPCVIWECIEARVPFISTVNGGIPELVEPEARERLLVQPEALALASRLAEALEASNWTEVAHAQPPETVGESWLSWLRDLPAPPARKQLDAQAVTVVLFDTGDDPALRRRLRELALQTVTDFELIVVSARSPLSSMEIDAVWIAEPRSGFLDALKTAAAAAANTPQMILAPTVGQLSPALVKTLSAGMRAYPDSIVTAQQAEAIGDDKSADLFTRPGLQRKAFAGGPLATGAFENSFGDLPLAVPRAALTEDLAWLPPDAATGWALLAAWALDGRQVVSLPVVLSARPPGDGGLDEREAHEAEQTRVKHLYARSLPPALADLVLCDVGH